MFKGKLKKVVVSTLALVMVVGTVAFASGVRVENIPATYGRIKFQSNGRDVTTQVNTQYGSPAFVSGGRSYVPVRAIGEVLGVKVDWDETTHTANFIDTKAIIMQQELNEKNKEISRLEKELKELKENKVDKDDLSDLQDSLQKDYKTYRNVDMDIKLKGTDKKVDVTIEIDLRNSNQERAWERISNNQKEKFIEDIVDSIKKEFKNADITGSIYDLDSRSDLYTFSQKGTGRLDIRDKDFDVTEIKKFIEEEIVYELKYERMDNVKAKATERNQRITVEVTFNKDKSGSIPSNRTFGDIFYKLEEDMKDVYGKDYYLEVDVIDEKDSRLGSYYNGTFK